ncbi:hypothetical protein MMC13_002701 [Lambiella insularis]|nr:hypothetical protein [Lambiella insularis]
MSRPHLRTYSFDNNDETSLSSFQEPHNSYPQPYRDTSPPSHQPPAYAPYRPEQQDIGPPPPPLHRSQPSYVSYEDQGNPFADPGYDRQDSAHTTSTRTASTATPGMDNLGTAAAGGGIAGIALGVANTNERDSGVQALRSIDAHSSSMYIAPAERDYNTHGSDTPYLPDPSYGSQPLRYRNDLQPSAQLSTLVPPNQSAAHLYDSSDAMQLHNYPPNPQPGTPTAFTDNPYKRFSSAWDPRVGQGDIHPDDIEDDGDDGITVAPSGRRSALNGAGAVLGGLGNMVGRKPSGTVLTPSGNYRPVAAQAYDGNGGEKSEWLASQTSGKKRLRWIFGTVITLLVIGGIVGGIIGGIKASQNKSNSASSSGGGGSAAQDDGSGDLDANSPEIKALLGNPNLHRVFPGMDYTPMNAQYPACLTNPPSQNNVTRDMAMLSQLTKTVRLYGTDCNQTDMVLHSINKLGLTDMKVWLAVWLDNNATTNARGMAAMYDIVNKNGAAPFAGVIIGNEVLFRKDMTADQLVEVVSDVKSNLTAKSIDLPVAVADLGDDWTAALTASVDVVMSNIHPFFAGVTAAEAAGWTWDFWQNNDVVLTKGTNKKHIISETGWPSTGGNDCGAVNCTSSTQGSIAGIDEMNTFMDDFVCQSLTNGTNYFWFEAFDEPWKIVFDTPSEQWEDKWGLMDSNRNLKSGVKIPDCGGKTV